MWLFLAFISAALLGCYDTCKKQALANNSVIAILFLNTLFSSLIFLPFILLSAYTNILDNSIFHVAIGGWEEHKYVLIKSCIVLTSWLLGYLGMKHLPLTIVGPINATRPVMVLVGAMVIFGERLNIYQWIGVTLAIVSIFLLSHSGKKEGIDFKHNGWIWAVILASAVGALSGLWDKYILAPSNAGGVGLDRMLVQSWFNIYQCFMMGIMLFLLNNNNNNTSSLKSGNFKETIKPSLKNLKIFPINGGYKKGVLPTIFISVFLSIADFAYFYALSLPDAMISIVSMVRRGSVIVSFLFGAWLFHEKNLKSKTFDLLLVLLGMYFLYLGSK